LSPSQEATGIIFEVTATASFWILSESPFISHPTESRTCECFVFPSPVRKRKVNGEVVPVLN
jgi:hypothetical protein